MPKQESVRLAPREPSDKWEPFEVDRFTRAIGRELRAAARPGHRGGQHASTARRACGSASRSRRTRTGCRPSRRRVDPMAWSTLSLWVGIALLATMLGSAAIARADQPAAAGTVVRGQPHPRGRVRLAPGREHADERDPPGQHGLQPHGARARQGRGRPRRDARRHLARPAHAAGAPAPRGRDERLTTRRPSATWRSTSTSSTRSSTSSWTTRARARSS